LKRVVKRREAKLCDKKVELKKRSNHFSVCGDEFGTTDACFKLEELNNLLVSETKTYSVEMERNLWRIIQSFAELFMQLEENNLYIDDISGSNFVLNGNYQAHLVDLDSLEREFEEKKCEKHADCVSEEDYQLHVRKLSLNIS